ncbi:rod shape-determining protein MreD [Cognatiyoonia koreensis]|uniref:Rod shape-determining protein MreD n=1 Tax=Cognatiyoonia koreensis TaxID=364200 RepID=A0A1I0MTY9_9RHOB|nr:hypothetical protein [Cognatiyoonia koreensis]SEV91756.1 rod shape-determining protein MreD [Cognatiyoonia koreensis]
MAELAKRQVWTGRGIYLALAITIIFIQLLPLDQRPTLFSPPDFLLVLTLVWVARRPDFVPFYMIGTVFFLTDLLFQRPPGLMSALVLIASEVIRSRAQSIRDLPFLGEFGLVAFAVIAVAAVNRATLAIVLTPQPYQLLELLHILATLIAIPFVMFSAQFIFGVRRPAPGQVDSMGQRL